MARLHSEPGRVRALQLVRDDSMSLTIDFIDIVRERAQRDPGFGEALLREALRCVYDGEPDVGSIVLHDYIAAALGFDAALRILNKMPEEPSAMLLEDPNPDADELLAMIAAIAEHEGTEIDAAALARDESAGLFGD